MYERNRAYNRVGTQVPISSHHEDAAEHSIGSENVVVKGAVAPGGGFRQNYRVDVVFLTSVCTLLQMIKMVRIRALGCDGLMCVKPGERNTNLHMHTFTDLLIHISSLSTYLNITHFLHEGVLALQVYLP